MYSWRGWQWGRGIDAREICAPKDWEATCGGAGIGASSGFMICLCILWIPVLSVAEHTWIRESWTMSLAWSPWPWEDLVDEVTYLASNYGGGLPHGPGTWDWDCKLGSSTKKKLRESLLTPPVAWTFLFKLKGCASTLHLHFILVSLNLAKALPEMIRPKLSATGSVQIVLAIESKAVDSIEIPQNLRAF